MIRNLASSVRAWSLGAGLCRVLLKSEESMNIKDLSTSHRSRSHHRTKKTGARKCKAR